MLALALVLALAAAPASDPPEPGRTVSGVTVSPKVTPPPADVKIDMQGSGDDIDAPVTVWPASAYQAGIDGHVTLSCLVDVHGLAERCDVASERPAGKGFGRAAMELRTTLKIAPTQGPDGPVNGLKTIEINFKAPDRLISGGSVNGAVTSNDFSLLTMGQGNALAMRQVTMLDAPVWAQAATFEDLARAYPAKGRGEEGYAVAHCQVRRTGALEACHTIKETPEGRDFGKAAVALAQKFKVTPDLAQAPHRYELWVDVPIRFPPPAELSDRTVTAPRWVTGFDPKAVLKLFPPEAAANGLTTGRGVARCAVAADGVLSNCAPEAGDPDGLGFSEAAAKLASGLRINLWSADGVPVAGGVIHVPVRLNLKGG